MECDPVDIYFCLVPELWPARATVMFLIVFLSRRCSSYQTAGWELWECLPALTVRDHLCSHWRHPTGRVLMIPSRSQLLMGHSNTGTVSYTNKPLNLPLHMFCLFILMFNLCKILICNFQLSKMKAMSNAALSKTQVEICNGLSLSASLLS